MTTARTIAHDDEPEGDLETVEDLRRDRHLGDVADAEVEAQQPRHPREVLRHERLVEPELRAQLRDRLLRGVDAERDAGRVAGQQRP